MASRFRSIRRPSPRAWLLALAVLAVLAIGYRGLWLLSDGVFFVFRTDQTFEQSSNSRLGTVQLRVWISESRLDLRRSLLVPCVFHVKRGAPYRLQLRASDLRLAATKMKVHSAVVVDSAGAEQTLLFRSSQVSRGAAWHTFRRNTNDWIVHLYHDADLELVGSFELLLDVSIELAGVVSREWVEVRMTPVIKKHSGLGFST